MNSDYRKLLETSCMTCVIDVVGWEDAVNRVDPSDPVYRSRRRARLPGWSVLSRSASINSTHFAAAVRWAHSKIDLRNEGPRERRHRARRRFA